MTDDKMDTADMTLPRCITCIHWDPYKSDHYYHLKNSGKCLAARQIWDVTESIDDPETNEETRVLSDGHAGLLAMVEDGSGYSASLITMQDFGCVQHKDKTP